MRTFDFVKLERYAMILAAEPGAREDVRDDAKRRIAAPGLAEEEF